VKNPEEVDRQKKLEMDAKIQKYKVLINAVAEKVMIYCFLCLKLSTDASLLREGRKLMTNLLSLLRDKLLL